MLNLTIFDDASGLIINVFVADDKKTIRDVKIAIQQQTAIPIERQQLAYDGNVLSNSETLASKNIKNDDVLTFQTLNLPVHQAFPTPQSYDMNVNRNPLETLDLTTTPTSQVIQAFRNNQVLMQQIMSANQQFAQAILNNNVEAVDQFLAPLREKQRHAKLLARLEANPFDVEAQTLLEEIIKKQNIEENMAHAMEYNPAAFASVYMLYINAEVNNIPLKAFVDSGAQMTIMSKECATKCDLMRLCDTRFSGIAKGVGTAKIIGRIHMAQLKIGKSFFPTTITVLDQDGMEFLIGLDMLKQWQACIDLKQNALIIDDEKAEFLAEKDLPNKDRQQQDRSLSSDPLSPLPPSQASSNASNTSTPSVQQQQLDILNSFLKTSKSGTGTTATPQSQSGVNEASVKQLMEMGFDRISVTEALEEANGNVEQATNILVRNKFGI